MQQFFDGLAMVLFIYVGMIVVLFEWIVGLFIPTF